MHKNLTRLLILFFLIAGVGFIILYIKNHIEETEYNKQENLRSTKIYSSALEEKNGFINIKLNTNIDRYPGFLPLPKSYNNLFLEYDKSIGECIWAYYAKDRKYDHILGKHHRLVNIISDGYTVSSDPKSIPDYYLFIHTLNNIIYKIEARIANSPESFNEILYKAYGPCVNDNSYNEVSYKNCNSLEWESSNIILYSRCPYQGDVELLYINKKIENKLALLKRDKKVREKEDVANLL